MYEGVLLFGVLMAAGLIYGVATQQRNALQGALGLRVFLFMVLGVYFVWFWSRRGQTLAMQTWHIRLLTTTGQPVSRLRAVCRYLLAWLWFMPALLALWLSGLKHTAPAFTIIATGVLAYAALAWLRPDRQFIHDALCGTCLVTWHPPQRAQTAA
ncbi:MAG: RDD family protein [Pseudomonadota bacterium]|nr:RDD family protein [Pseudomonadota bacterium]